METLEGPGPNAYLGHNKMTTQRSLSAERNCARATIGNEPRSYRVRGPTPGPANYNTSRK